MVIVLVECNSKFGWVRTFVDRTDGYVINIHCSSISTSSRFYIVINTYGYKFTDIAQIVCFVCREGITLFVPRSCRVDFRIIQYRVFCYFYECSSIVRVGHHTDSIVLPSSILWLYEHAQLSVFDAIHIQQWEDEVVDIILGRLFERQTEIRIVLHFVRIACSRCFVEQCKIFNRSTTIEDSTLVQVILCITCLKVFVVRICYRCTHRGPCAWQTPFTCTLFRSIYCLYIRVVGSIWFE